MLTYIEERAGTEFEPEIATAFVKMMRKLESGIQLSPMAPNGATNGNGNGQPHTGAPGAPEGQSTTQGKTPERRP